MTLRMKRFLQSVGVFFGALVLVVGLAFVLSFGSQKAAVAMISFSPVVAIGAAVGHYKRLH